MGFVFQFYNLVSNLTAKENVELASEIVTDALDPEQVLADVGAWLIAWITFQPSFLVGSNNEFPSHEQ